jgi:uncharacterized protein DUF6999
VSADLSAAGGRVVTADQMVWAAVLSDPALPFDRETLRLVVNDQRRPTRRWLYPVLRPLSRIAVGFIVVLKRMLGLNATAHGVMDRLCVWFLRHCVSSTAGSLLIRHFIIETNLLAFVARNAGGGVPEVTLRPTTLRELGNRAVIEHDVNVYDVLTALGVAAGGRPLPRLNPAELDYSMLEVPPIDAEPRRRRWPRLDIQSALCLMNIPFALCLSPQEYRRAVHSLRLDFTLMGVLADLTGDPTFRTWAPSGVVVRLDTTLDVPRAVYEHAVFCEYAHAWLLRMRDAARTNALAEVPVAAQRPPVGITVAARRPPAGMAAAT